MKKYWQVDVRIRFENDNGKIQKVTEKYLVEAVSATDAETIINKEFSTESDFEVVKCSQTKILKVL